MSDTKIFAPGAYRYIPSVFQYSAGVAAEEGYEIERVRFAEPLPMSEAFAAVEAHLKSIGRPLTAFAQCELRSAEPFTEQGFIDFNRHYVTTLERWGIYKDGDNPVARTNVCLMYNAPSEPSMLGFSYTVPASKPGRRTFVLSGGAEARSGTGSFSERVLRLGDTSAEALHEKVVFVIAEMERRLKALGFTWKDASSTHAYTVQNIGHLVGPELARRGALPGGLVWFYARPPVVGLEYEMDVHGVARQLII